MQKSGSFLVFFALFCLPISLFAQSEDWRQLLLELADTEALSESSYERFLEMIEEIEADLQPPPLLAFPLDSLGLLADSLLLSDSLPSKRRNYPRSTLLLRSDRGEEWRHLMRYRRKLTPRWNTGAAFLRPAGASWHSALSKANSYSLFTQYKAAKGPIKRAVVGHYRLRLGSGLILNQQLSLGKFLTAHSLLQAGSGITPVATTFKEDLMQGLAMQFEHIAPRSPRRRPYDTYRTRYGVLAFASSLREDEMWKTDVGFRASARTSWFEFGSNVVYSHLQHDIDPAPRKYNRYHFRGHQFLSTSIDYRIHILRFWMRGETAIDDRAALATVGALSRNIGMTDWTVTLLWRAYGDRYRQLHGNALAESSAMQGERGLSLLAEGYLPYDLSLSLWFDYFHFSQPQYNIYRPSRGWEAHVRLVRQYEPFTTSLCYRIKQKAKNNTLTQRIDDDITYYLRHSLDASFLFAPPQLDFSFRTQLHGRIYSAQNIGGFSDGYSLSQSIDYTPSSSRFTASLQATLFRTEDYDTRIYLSERTIPFGLGLPMLYGQGQRYSALATFKLASTLSLEAKYALSHYRAASRPDQQRIWLQLRAKF